MKDDASILRIYLGFRHDLLPDIKKIEQQEKVLLSRRHFFNKESINKQIIALYDLYDTKLSLIWKSIYSSQE